MKTVNNKIKKPFVSIGFDATGKLTSNVDLNKTNKLYGDNLVDLRNVFENVISAINNSGSNTTLHVFHLYTKKTGITFARTISVTQLEEIRAYLLNNQKLGAVKAFKDYTGEGLRDSKDFVDFYNDYLKVI